MKGPARACESVLEPERRRAQIECVSYVTLKVLAAQINVLSWLVDAANMSWSVGYGYTSISRSEYLFICVPGLCAKTRT